MCIRDSPDTYHCPVLQLDTIGVGINSKNEINIPSLDSMILHGYEHMGEIKAPLNVGKK